MDKLKEEPKDIIKEDPAELLKKREEINNKINDRNTPITEKFALSAKLLKIDGKIAKASKNIGVMK